MTIENQVCTFEQAKSLDKLGISQGKSMFVHNSKNLNVEYNIDQDGSFYTYNYDAFNVSELGVMLPEMIEHIDNKQLTGERQWELFCGKDEDGYFTGYFNATINPSGLFLFQLYGDTEAESRAKMVIALLEDSITTKEEINERLSNS